MFFALRIAAVGRLLKMAPINAEKFSALFLALFIRERLICMP